MFTRINLTGKRIGIIIYICLLSLFLISTYAFADDITFNLVQGFNGMGCIDYPSDFLDRGRFPVYKKQFNLLKEKVGDKMAIFGESEGAFTCGANLVGTENFMKWTFKRAKDVEKVLEITKQAMIADGGATAIFVSSRKLCHQEIAKNLKIEYLTITEKKEIEKTKGFKIKGFT